MDPSKVTLQAVKNRLTELAGAISGSELQVDIVSSALPTGAATQTTLAALLVELALKADLTETQPVGGFTVPVQATITRPADTTAYTALDCITDAGAGTIDFAGAGRVVGGTGYITGLQFETDQAANVSEYVLYLFQQDPAAIIADNAVWNSLDADKAIRIIPIDIPACAAVGATGDTAIIDVTDLKIPYKCAAASTSIKGQLKTVTGFTPVSGQVFTITLYFDQN